MNQAIYSIIHNTNNALIDLTGRFPYKSFRGNNYILIAYHGDANAIIGTLVKNRQANALKNTWLHIDNKFLQSAPTPDMDTR